MTWVVGATSMFGYGVIVSDIQVTCGNDRKDILLKAFPMGKNIAAGFAGDVYAGFALINCLSEFLNSVEIADDERWSPRWVAEHWGEEAKKVYQHLSSERSVGPTDILMVGAQPEGTPENPVWGGAIGHISVFRSPDFIPDCKEGGKQAMSIGCGSSIEVYTEALEYIMRDRGLVHMTAGMGSDGGHARMITFKLQMTVQKNPTLGISEHFHMFLIRLSEVEQYNTQDMPAVATTWSELLQVLDEDADATLLTAAGQ